MLMLRGALNRRIGRTGLPVGYVAKLWAAAAVAAGVAWWVKIAASASLHPVILAGLVIGPYLAVYLGTAALLRIPTGIGGLRLKRPSV
jgi:hypothetical protein